MQVVEIVPVCDTSIYANNDVLFVPLELSAFGAAGKARKLCSIVAIDEADQAQALDVVFSDGSITLGTINGAVNLSDADARKILGVVRIATSDYSDTINNQVATKTGINLVLQPTTSLYIGGIVRSGTPTYTASALRLKLGFEDQAK